MTETFPYCWSNRASPLLRSEDMMFPLIPRCISFPNLTDLSLEGWVKSPCALTFPLGRTLLVNFWCIWSLQVPSWQSWIRSQSSNLMCTSMNTSVKLLLDLKKFRVLIKQSTWVHYREGWLKIRNLSVSVLCMILSFQTPFTWLWIVWYFFMSQNWSFAFTHNFLSWHGDSITECCFEI